MKKLAIAGASVALATMPVVGVFAVDSTPADTVTDTLNLSVLSGCTMTRNLTGENPAADADQTYSFGSVAAGHTAELTGSTTTAITPIKISCNGGSYNLQAVGSTVTGGLTPATGVTADAASLIQTSGNSIVGAIPSSNTGGLDGSDSEWAFKIITNGEGITASGSYGTAYQAAQTNAQTIATITNVSTNVSFTPNYKVSVGANQLAGTYNGKITYSIAPQN